MVFEVSGQEMGGRLAQIAGGVGPLCQGPQVASQQQLLFRNNSETSVVLVAGDIIGHAKLAGLSEYNPEWIEAVHKPGRPHPTQTVKGVKEAGSSRPSAERVAQLVKQLGIKEIRLLKKHPQVMSKLIT